jgi:hypothetical protein
MLEGDAEPSVRNYVERGRVAPLIQPCGTSSRQELWDRIRRIITRKASLIERFEELLLLLKKTFG